MKEIITTQINLYNCRGLDKFDKDLASYFLDKLVQFIGMRKIPPLMMNSCNPNCFEFVPSKVGLEESERGVSGVVLMFESHCALHTWIDHGFCSITICSCKRYDRDSAATFCASFFESNNYDIF